MVYDARTRAPQNTHPGWWQASDGNWYPPEQHPDYVAPVPQGLPTFAYVPPLAPNAASPTEGTSGNRLGLWIGLGTVIAIALAVGVWALASGGGQHAPQTSSGSVSAPPGVSAAALASLNQQFLSDLATESVANHAYAAAFQGATSDINTQDQRIQQDQTTVSSNEGGVGCNPADFTSYGSCAQSEDQQASTAQNDEAAATAQIQTDYQQYASAASTYEAAVSAFVGQLVALPWPAQMNAPVNAVVGTARQFRNDLAQEGAVNSNTPSATISAIQAQTGTDVGNYNDAINVVRAALPRVTTS